MDSGGPPGPKEACVRWDCTLVNTTELSVFDGDADFLSYYSDHLFGWRRGLVASVVRRMNEVTLRRVRLVLGWVTVFGRVYHHGM